MLSGKIGENCLRGYPEQKYADRGECHADPKHQFAQHSDQFVEKQVDAGRYRNASEVLRAGLRLVEQQTQIEDQKLEALRKLAAEGFRELDQGQGSTLTSESSVRSAIAIISRRSAEASNYPQAGG
ncbi:type II toxin-antitoxin system ParD family antitoxin [Schlesneria sp.]|uniref:type II toxin-antitoxin system ParD family antitoxin n=1 Tax=Schlesneria sp. TaxID=2762018 RepID=UPI002EFEA581